MVKKINRNGILYVGKDNNTVTIDDPVGSYILKRLENDPNSKTKIGKSGKQICYKEILEKFEKSFLEADIYNSILSRVKKTNTPLVNIWKQAKGRKKIESEFYNMLLSQEFSKLPEEEKNRLFESFSSQKTLEDYVFNFVEKNIERIPQWLTYRKKVSRELKPGNLKGLEKTLTDLREIIIFNLGPLYRDFLRRKTNQDLLNEYCDATRGNVFDLCDIVNKIEERRQSD